MSQHSLVQSNFVGLSALLFKRFWLLLLASALFGAAALYIVQLSTAERYEAVAVVTLTDWQTERLSRRDDPNDKNPANVGGASADAVSRALLWLKAPDFFQSLARAANAKQLSVEHKRRGNLVTLRWNSNSAKNAETELALVIRLWDQRWRQQFIEQKRQQLLAYEQLEQTSLLQQERSRAQHELAFASKAQPFAVQQLQKPESSPQSQSPALGLVVLFGAVLGFSCGFIVLMLWRL